MNRVGFVGLGVMGTPMAGHLIEGGRVALLQFPRRSRFP